MLPPHDTFRRYMIVAGINVIVFYAIWEFLYWIWPNSGYWPTVAWAAAWILGSFFAHFTHREWTFDSDRRLRWTITASMSIYTIGMVGSTACFYVGTVDFELDARLVWLLNSSLWGVLNYLGQREIAFKTRSLPEVNTE